MLTGYEPQSLLGYQQAMNPKGLGWVNVPHDGLNKTDLDEKRGESPDTLEMTAKSHALRAQR